MVALIDKTHSDQCFMIGITERYITTAYGHESRALACMRTTVALTVLGQQQADQSC